MVSLVNSHTNATSIGWHLWQINLRFAPGLPPGWKYARGGQGFAPLPSSEARCGGGTRAKQPGTGVCTAAVVLGLPPDSQRTGEGRTILFVQYRALRSPEAPCRSLPSGAHHPAYFGGLFCVAPTCSYPSSGEGVISDPKSVYRNTPLVRKHTLLGPYRSLFPGFYRDPKGLGVFLEARLLRMPYGRSVLAARHSRDRRIVGPHVPTWVPPS